jgi:hypothetical protein
MASIEDYGYQRDRRPDALVVEAFQRLSASPKHKAILKTFRLASPFRVVFVEPLNEDHVARYIDGSASPRRKGIVVVDASAFDELEGWRLEEQIEATLLHEYGHALFASALTEEERPEPNKEEIMVESFARRTLREPAARTTVALLRVVAALSRH